VGRTARTHTKGQGRRELLEARTRRFREGSPNHQVPELPTLISEEDLHQLRHDIPPVSQFPFYFSELVSTYAILLAAHSPVSQLSYECPGLSLGLLDGQMRGMQQESSRSVLIPGVTRRTDGQHRGRALLGARFLDL
jgi:hypothetical protein